MRTMKDVKHQMRQLLVAMETPAPHHHRHSTPSQRRVPVGASTPWSWGAGSCGVPGSQLSRREHLWASRAGLESFLCPLRPGPSDWQPLPPGGLRPSPS